MKSDSNIPKQFDWQESTELAISNKRKALPNRLFVKNPFYNVKTRCMLIICEVYYFLLSISCFLGFNKTPFQNYILCFVPLSQDMYTYIKNARKEYIERKILKSYSLSNDHITSLPAKLWSHTENHFPSFFLLLTCGTHKRATIDRSIVSFATKQVTKHCWGTRTVINTWKETSIHLLDMQQEAAYW